MAGALGHEISEVPRNLEPDLVVYVILRLFDDFIKNRIQVFTVLFDL